jgi:hypothetical protein
LDFSGHITIQTIIRMNSAREALHKKKTIKALNGKEYTVYDYDGKTFVNELRSKCCNSIIWIGVITGTPVCERCGNMCGTKDVSA